MVDMTFVFLLVVTVGLGVRSLLDTYSVRELATRLFGLVALSFILLITLDFSVLQQPPGNGYSSSPGSGGLGNLESGVGLSGGGKEGMANWRQKLLPAGFGPAGMSLPPWSPYKVEEAGSTGMMPVGGAPGSGMNNAWNGAPGGGAFGVPALNGMPSGAAVGYYPPYGGGTNGAAAGGGAGGGGSVVIPGMAGSFVAGANGMVWRPDPTKPPLPPPPAPQPAPPPPDPVAAQALAKLTDLLERQMNRLEEKESEQRRAMSKSYKQNVKLSGDIYRLTTDNKHRVDRVAALEREMGLLTRETAKELSKIKSSDQGSSRPLYGWDAAKAHANAQAKLQASDAAWGPSNSNQLKNNSQLAELESKIDLLARLALNGGGSNGGGGGGDGLKHSSVGGASSKALRNAQAEVDRLRAEAAALRSSKQHAETSLEQLQSEVKNQRPQAERAKGAFAVLANTDPFSIKAALAVCHMLVHHRTMFDVLVITPTRTEAAQADAVRRGGCHPTTLGLAPYPPKFAPMRPSFRVCWHKLRLFLLTQYSAIVALDSDIVVLSNIDELVTKVLEEPGDSVFWMAAHDETPLCEKCGAEVSGAPNAGVFGLRPSRMVYERLIERSKKPSPWYGDRWAYSEQELLSVFFLVEKETHNSRIIWLDNAFNSFACKYACPPPAGGSSDSSSGGAWPQPSILHFVGVDKPYTLFVDAPRRSRVVNALTRVDVSHAFVAEHVQVHYQRWFEHYMAALKRSLPQSPHPQLQWHDPIVGTQAKRWVAFLHVPKTGGSALISTFMMALFGEWWFHLDCGLKAKTSSQDPRQKSDAPPLCATYGAWTEPKKRKVAHQGRCTAIGCLGHLPFENMRAALGGELLKATDFITVLRKPTALFVSEYYYIRDQLSLPGGGSLQFVGDPELLTLMAGGISLAEYVAYTSKLVKHGRTGLGSAFNRQTYFLTTASVEDMRVRSDSVFHEAAVKLNKMDFVGITEEMDASVKLLSCVLGVPPVTVPKKNVGSYQPGTEDPAVLKQIDTLLELDRRVYSFGLGLFHTRQKAVHFMRQHYRYC